MWPFYKKKKISLNIHDVFEIIIRYKNDKRFSYNITEPFNSGKSCVQIFYDFYKWYYYRDSPAFSFTHSDGLDILVRSEISSVSMRKSTKNLNDNR